MRLAVTDWTSYLYFTQTLAFFGSLLGLALGISRFQSRSAFWLAIAYGSAVIPLQLTRAIEAQAPLYEKLSILAGRLFFSLDQFVLRKPVDDALFFVTLVAIAYFAVAVAAGYWLTRHGNSLVGIILTGMATLIIHAYDSFLASRLWIAAAFAFTALLLLGRMHFVRERERWVNRRVFLSPDSGQDINRQIMVLAAIAILITWTIPVSINEWKSALASWNRFTRPLRENFSNAVSALESPYGSRESSEFYGDQLSLGRVAAQGNTPVLLIKVEDILREEPPRYYWRGRVYDDYSNGKWTNRSTRISDFDPEQDRLNTLDEGRRLEVRFTVTMRLKEQSLLYMPAETFWVNRDGSVEVVPIPDQRQDLTAWIADPALTMGSRYQVRTLIGNPSIPELRDAGSDYPEWVTERYLQIPEEIETQIRDLAEEVTSGMETPYDKTTAITGYLRRELEYSTALIELPRNRDPLLWVLFDYKKGFCMYYASAEVLMLRSLGIPARLAVGFAEGQYNEEEQTYTVIRTDAHAWPEVYFPGIGWVEFEPTANQVALDRPVGEQPGPNVPFGTPIPEIGENIPPVRSSQDQFGLGPDRTTATNQTGDMILRFIYVILVIGLMAAGIFLTRRYSLAERLPVYLESRYLQNGNQPPRWLVRWARWAKLTSIEKSFEAVNLSLRLMGHPQAMHVTPAERAQKLRELLPKASESIDILVEEHQTALFTPRAGNSVRARRAGFRIILETWHARLTKDSEHL
jgi:transglutaminase-like putative cysteine protease